MIENEFDGSFFFSLSFQIIDDCLLELNTLSKMYQISSEEEEIAKQKYLKISNRKEYDQQRVQANEECFAFKKKFHQVT